MTVDTKAYGPIEVEEKQKVVFEKGLFGFEDLRNYVLLDSTQEPFYWLQSMDYRDIAFILINPLVFRTDFAVETAVEELEAIDLAHIDMENSLVFAIVTIPEDSSKMSANLQGPLVINRENHKGRQVISSNNKWMVKHYILEELAGRPSC